MSQEIEIEFKNLLMMDEFHTLLKAFNIDEEYFVIQHNDYFDTARFDLKTLGAALRIREKRGQKVLTLKQPRDVGLLETHQPLTNEEAESVFRNGNWPHGDVVTALTHMNITPRDLKHLGRLTTKRAEIPYRDGGLVFDHSFYNDTEDYELEYEVKDPVEGGRIFTELLQHFSIPKRKTENKIRRLFNTKS